MSKDIIDQKVMKMLKLIGLEGYEDKNTTLLSGGQQQRVAIARALVNEPKVLLLDEPLAALDLKLRKEMQYELKRIQQEVGITFIFVTHDQEEALTMSDKIVVMQKGEILQIGTPQEIYNEPTNRFVANFIGESNIISGRMIEDYKVRFDDITFDCVDQGFKENEPVDVVIRPEDIDIVDVKDGKMTIHISLASKNIVNLFVGTAEDAQKDGAALLEPTTDTVKYADGTEEEVYGFDVPVEALDQEFDLAILGKKGKWYDHKVSVADAKAAEE